MHDVSHSEHRVAPKLLVGFGRRPGLRCPPALIAFVQVRRSLGLRRTRVPRRGVSASTPCFSQVELDHTLTFSLLIFMVSSSLSSLDVSFKSRFPLSFLQDSRDHKIPGGFLVLRNPYMLAAGVSIYKPQRNWLSSPVKGSLALGGQIGGVLRSSEQVIVTTPHDVEGPKSSS